MKVFLVNEVSGECKAMPGALGLACFDALEWIIENLPGWSVVTGETSEEAVRQVRGLQNRFSKEGRANTVMLQRQECVNPASYWFNAHPPMPERFAEALVRYCGERQPCGHFLMAVLKNDLREAFSRADHEALQALPSILGWLYNEAPGGCHGSPEKVKEWLEKAGQK